MNLKPNITAPLDPGFIPAVVFNREYVKSAKATGKAVPVVIGLEREAGLLSRYETFVRSETDADTLLYIDRVVKFLLWAWGGWKVYFSGPKDIGAYIQKTYSKRGARKFDCEMMNLAYGKDFQVVLTHRVPATKEMQMSAGGHLKGNRIGFDLGASDYKVSAVINGTPVFTEEIPWDPKTQPNPEYHYHHITSGLHRAAAYLPKVDAIGGSSAGIIVNNEIRVASLLRAITKKDYPKAAGVFTRIAEEWGVPVTVMNDGDVTALAAALSLRIKGVLGIAMGSSQAAGFIDRKGRVLGWLNELAFVPVDYNPQAAADEWSKDTGVGALYFSQQAVNKLLPAAGIKVPAEMGLPERLKEVQALMAKGDKRAAKIYETIGVYLGYAIAQYTDFYDYQHMLILGRVTTGKGGDIVLAKAKEVLAKEFPDVARKVQLHVPDEKSRRVGQAVAAASLPE
jgi:predicted NBD/HSP70 family sugar kinase